MDVNSRGFDVRALAQACLDTVTPLAKEGVELRCAAGDDVIQAHTDDVRLRQMLINLLSNGIKFTDAGSVTLSAAREGDQLIFSVKDTGKGIPIEDIDSVFEEYRQVKGSESTVQKGTGLGLPITRKFAELLGGTVSVESVVGEGSTFTVKVPAEYREPA